MHVVAGYFYFLYYGKELVRVHGVVVHRRRTYYLPFIQNMIPQNSKNPVIDRRLKKYYFDWNILTALDIENIKCGLAFQTLKIAFV